MASWHEVEHRGKVNVDEILDEEAETRTLHIEFDVLMTYYEDRVKVTLSNPDFDGELTFETTTGNKARQVIDDLEQGEDEKEVEPPKAVPPPVQPRYESAPRPVQPQPMSRPQQVPQPQPQAQTQTVDIQSMVKQSNPLFDIATDIAEIVRLGSELKPKIDKLRGKR